MRKSYFLLLILVFSTYNLRASMSPEPIAVLPAGHAMLGGGGPDNDLCSSVTAVALSVDSTLTFTGDNTAATFDGDAVEGSVLFQFPFANTWHAFTTTECTNVTVSYCATDSGWSNVWRLLTTQCPAESEINASSSDTTTCTNGNWTFTFNELEPGTYYLPVPNVGFGQGGGPYQIELSAASCVNEDQGTDLCSDAVPQQLSVGTTLNLSGDNSTATFAGDAVEGSVLFQYPSANTWHAFTTTECTNVTVSYCATDSGWSNVWRLLTTQCPAESEINASTSDTTTCTNGNWTFTFNELEPGTYYLPVPNVGFGQGGGPYQIELSAASCVNEDQGTDLCSDAVPQQLSVGATLNLIGDNSTATFAGDAVEGSVLFQYPSANTWHAFTTTECTNVTVSYCATDSGWSNVWRLLTTQCPAESEINASSSDTTTCTNGNWTFTFNELEPGTYYLPVPNVGFGQGGGPYQIELSAASCANDDQGTDLCSDAVPQQLSVGATLNLIGDNSTATFAGDAVEGSVLFQYPSANTWHAFTTTECTNVTVSYCATDSGWSNVWRLLTTQCPAESEINASTSDTTTCINGNWTFTFNELEPGTYYLPVPNVGFGQGGGPYQIELSAASCANENQGTDLCSDVIPEDLPVDTTLIFVGDNTDATFDGDAELGNVMSQYPSPNTWHAFTTTECSNVTVSYCSTDSGWSNIWSLLTMYCPADSLINASFSDTTSCANGNWTFSFDQLAAGTYYLPVPNVGFGQGGGAYSIEVSAISCTVGVGIDITTSTDWQVFPNPTTGDVSISTPNTSGPADLVLMDMTGRAVLSQQVVLKAGGTVQLSLDAHIASGTYLLQMTTVNSRSSQRLIVR